jgi:hypothetical protein
LEKHVQVEPAFGLCVAARNVAFEDDVYPDVESVVLPDPTKRYRLKWSEIRSRVTKVKNRVELVDEERVKELLEVKDKKDFSLKSEEMWPPRTKMDLSLRRSRLLDWVKIYRANGQMSWLYDILRSTRAGWDLIFVTNVVAAAWVFGSEWWDRWNYLGAWSGDLGHFLVVAKEVHNLAKTVGIEDKRWMDYAECTVLCGYRNPPFPGFDVFEEAEALAHGGTEHRLFGHTWDALVAEFLPMSYHPVSWIPFKQFVVQADWLTSGASSVGRVTVQTDDGKELSIKARKNMVADVCDLEKLADDALAATKQINHTIIKSELGKIRLAVAGDIYTYLKQTWINYLLGGAYYDWPGNTSEESFTQQTERLAKMVELCSTHLGLPYDYKGFDHQPTTPELKGIVRRLVSHARLNVPSDSWDEYDAIGLNVIEGFDQSILLATENGKTEEYDVSGGLMSGLRWTSVVGNAWNSVMTGLCLKLLTAWGIPTGKIVRYIRGDDSAIYVPNWATGAAMNLAYDAVGAEAGVGKFSLQDHAMEFLRVWITSRCSGFAPRSIPSLTQRKPWSSQPWSEDMEIRAIYDACKILRRRCSSTERIDKAWLVLRRIWCVNHNLPEAVMWTPTWAGGFGIEPPAVAQEWTIKPPVPKAALTGFHITNQTSWRATRLQQRIQTDYGIDLGPRALEVASEELKATISADNIPSVATRVRQQWLRDVRSARCKAHRVLKAVNIRPPEVYLPAYQPSKVADLMQRLHAVAPLFGKCPEIIRAKNDYNIVRPKISFNRWVDRYFPDVSLLRRRFHRSWHISEIYDYLSGFMTLAPARIHPALVKVLALYTAGVFRPSKRIDRYSTVWAGSVYEADVLVSPLSQIVYSW